MAAKEIKSELKCARDAIQNKDYQTALKHCKAVLKLDKTNYNAIVFIGVASLELKKPEQAKAAYKKAIKINTENILAWQGLASLHEKGQDYVNKEDMIEVYEKLISYYQSSDEKKWRDTVVKLADLQKLLKHVDKALQLLMLLTASGHIEDQYTIWCKIISLLQENESMLATAERNQLEHAYKMVLNSGYSKANDQTKVYFQNYINLLLDPKPDGVVLPKTVISEAIRMRELFRNDEYSLNVLVRMYLEEIQEVSEEESTICQELLDINPGSPLGLLGMGKVKLFEKDLNLAKELIQNGLQVLPTSSPGWYYLSTIHLSHHEYVDGVNSAIQGLSAFKRETIVGDADLIHFKLSFCRAAACSKQGKDKMSSAVQYFEELLRLRPNAVDVHVEPGRTFIRLDDLDSAKKCLETCRGVDDDAVPIWLALEGEIYLAEGQYEKAQKSFLQLIELQNDVAENYFNLGKLYWKMEGRWRSEKNKCLNHLLKAARLDPLHSSTFLYLGHFYKVIGLDMSKAHRCYKKALELNPTDDEAGEALGDVCMNLELEDEAVQLYKRFTTAAGIGRAKWAWLRLGLYYLKQELYDDSVRCLQNALRVDVKDPHSWECLGEAYVSRGSYTAALASFTRATELDQSLLYSRYQIAAVKHLLGLLAEAVLVYKSILDEQPNYVPGLKGLGETYISYARSALSQDFNSRAVDYIQDAIVVLARAIQYHSNLSCLWKLLGDVCSLVYKIHESKIRLDLPCNLRTFLGLETDCRVGKLEVLNLGSSSYGQAVRYNPRCSGLWHDLGLSCFRMSSVQKDIAERQRLCERSVKALKKGLSIDPGNYYIWNTLGIVAASKEMNNPELSQHAFLKSIQCQKNAMAWTNLGVLYLLHDKADMANRAFNDAQCLDPSYTEAWIGQATIAEMFGHEESMDLFRHSNELGSHVEGYLGYAHWACDTLLSTNDGQRSCVMKSQPFADLSHLPAQYRTITLTASVALTKYTDQIQDNPCAFNMHGILLEHQKLYSQAEAAYASSLKLLESRDDSNQDHCNIVRANYARVLRVLGKYSESVEAYQTISPLTDFYHITGLALAFFMAGQLRESYQAYEQAFELASSGAQKSHIRAAMGMIGYVLKDISGSKKMLFESMNKDAYLLSFFSTQMQPASEQGLLALSAIGLITSDVTLAAAALTELVKVGQGGNENLIAEASYLFATFYALQGSPGVGKSYIVREIHRRPHSSLLWNNLATFMIRHQSNRLDEAGRCAEAAHRLGDRNVKGISTTYAYSTIGAGRSPMTTTSDVTGTTSRNSKLLCGVRAAQKAVHIQPDSFTNWALLAAAMADVMIDDKVARPTMKRHKLCEVMTQFALAKAIEESKTTTTRPQEYRKRHLHIVESTQKWLALQFSYCLYYSKKRKEAVEHCQQALQIWSTDPTFSARIQLLAVEIDSSRENIQIQSVLDDILKVLVLNQQSCYAWLFVGSFCERHGFVRAAEYCYRHCFQLGTQQGSLHGRVVPLIRLAHLALRQTMSQDHKSQWVDLILEASAEVLKLVPDCMPAVLLQGISHYLNNHIRQAKDLLHTINKPQYSCGAVAGFYLVLLNMKKRDKGETIDDVVRRATSENTSRSLQDLLVYFLALHFEGNQRKILLQKCIHINPSERQFWEALNKL